MAETTGSIETSDEDKAKLEIARLRAELDEVKAKFNKLQSQSDARMAIQSRHPWLQIATTVGITFALGKLIQALRLPTAAAVAIPMITTEVNRRVF
ncbi:hypothetical protein HW571_22820 [Agrobacterium genomosp. 3]|uniref:hypothetical protein n=1 Tax=Agrobacterium tomkonis TaxID=1183410 RepID=UPI001CD84C25|nr:hypothetical protein [Agrobacterium tomkonis]MCA1878843.1 hypothetical protein [Agrobacterium tumefaciens]MCA1894075.1 hypothetical protein [Agrobacterium tomkonis]